MVNFAVFFFLYISIIYSDACGLHIEELIYIYFKINDNVHPSIHPSFLPIIIIISILFHHETSKHERRCKERGGVNIFSYHFIKSTVESLSQARNIYIYVYMSNKSVR